MVELHCFFFFLILYFIWLRQVLAVARWDLVPWPGIKSMPPAVEAVLNTAPPREAPANFFKEEWWRLWKVRSHIIWVTKDAEDGGEGKMIIESYFFSVYKTSSWGKGQCGNWFYGHYIWLSMSMSGQTLNVEKMSKSNPPTSCFLFAKTEA